MLYFMKTGTICIFILTMLCFSNVDAQKLPGDPDMLSAVEKIRFLEECKEYIFNNGAIVSFTEPIGDIDFMVHTNHSSNIWSGQWGYYAVVGVGVKIQNTSNNVMVIKWNQSSFRIGMSKGLPFLGGMKYMNAGNPSAIPDTVLAPGEIRVVYVYSSEVKFEKKWKPYYAYLSDKWETNSGVYLKIECNGESDYYAVTSPNIGFKLPTP